VAGNGGISKGGKDMILYDITMTIEPDMAVYKNKQEKKPMISVTRNFSEGAMYESRLCLDMHTGTHIDMPLHVFPGAATVGQWDKQNMLTRCKVLDFTSLEAPAITAAHLRVKDEEMRAVGQGIEDGDSVLLKTKNSLQDDFDFSFIYLEKTGAAFFTDQKVRSVGIDALGIERDQPQHETHKLLLGAGIWILEGLRLKEVPQGQYILLTMPMKIKGTEAAPARVALLSVKDLLGLSHKEG
jgi:arylformamidase